MMQAHSVLEDYSYNPHTGGGHEGIYSKPVYNLSRLCNPGQHNPQERLAPQDGGLSRSSSMIPNQPMYSNNQCHHNTTPYRFTSLTIPVMPAKKFRTEQAEILRCKRRVDLSHKIGYKSHPTAVARRNERERNRVKHINSTFATLRQHIPCAAKNKKMSKVETLRSAIKYINHLQHILDSQSTCSDGIPDELEESSRLGHPYDHGSDSPSPSLSSPGGMGSSNPGRQSPHHERIHSAGSAALLSPPATPESDNTCSTPGSEDRRGTSYYRGMMVIDADDDGDDEEEEVGEEGSLSQFADWF